MLVIAFGAVLHEAQAATFYSRASARWDANTTWSTVGCGGVAAAAFPGAGDDDDVIICNTHTIELRSNAQAAHVTVQNGGVLSIGRNNNNATFAPTFSGTLTIDAGGTVQTNTTSNTTHTLTMSGGDIVNNGTFNMASDANSLCNVTFRRTGSQTVSGGGAVTTFNRITLDMGTSNANVLEVTATNFTAATGFLTITNGTFKLSADRTIVPFSAAPTIPASGGFWVNNGTANSGNFNWTLSGLLRVSGGTLNLGNSSENRLLPTTGATILIEGGAMNIAGRFARNALNDNFSFTLSSGTLTVCTVGCTSTLFAAFYMDAGPSFTMSGGTIVVQNPSNPGGVNLGYTNLAVTTNVTGGTLQIGNASTPVGRTFNVNSSAPVWDFTVNNTNNPTALLATNNLTVKRAVTVGGGGNGTLNANNLNITVGGGGAGGGWTNNGTFTPGTGTVTFNDSAAQGITGVTTFYHLVVNNAAGLTANSNLAINGNFTNTAGFNAGTTTTTFGGTALQTLAGATTFYDLVFNNAAGFTLDNDVTASNSLTLTSGVIATGTANALVFDSPSTCSVMRTSGRVNGWLRKRFTGTQLACDFEIGDASNYTPVNVSFGSVGTSGTVTANTTGGGDHPQIGASSIDSSRSVNRYWTLTPGGLGFSFTNATLSFTYIGGVPVDNDDNTAATVNNYIVQRYEITTGDCDTGSGSWNDTTINGTPTATNASATDISTFGSLCSQFAVGKRKSISFTREKEYIYTRELFY